MMISQGDSKLLTGLRVVKTAGFHSVYRYCKFRLETDTQFLLSLQQPLSPAFDHHRQGCRRIPAPAHHLPPSGSFFPPLGPLPARFSGPFLGPLFRAPCVLRHAPNKEQPAIPTWWCRSCRGSPPSLPSSCAGLEAT